MLHIILLDREADYYLGNSMHQGSNKNLDCDDGDCYEMVTITSDFDMVIIILDIHCSVLTCQHALSDALSMSHGQHVNSRGTCTCPVAECALRRSKPKLLVGCKCASTRHMENPNPSIGA
jgi:hypothetical protein